MLLRRVIEHVRAQNWTAVGIDFVIVVVGILLALQISDWNQARQDRVRERAYSDDIHSYRQWLQEAQALRDRITSHSSMSGEVP